MADRPTGRPRTIDPDRVSLVALRLFDERGYDLVSMDEVAAAAGVSRRSLFRLFPTKASLVWGGLDEFAERLTAALDARPAAEPARAGLRAAYRTAATFPDAVVETTRHRLRVIRANPTLAREAPPDSPEAPRSTWSASWPSTTGSGQTGSRPRSPQRS
ncbi:TetR/AcrR family transcriptional regulator [Curtobacterium sp. MCJR17_043]|uniref:TetR/AcrR family transcriptional regulator n=1 Tax=Curtobacterium sp. MCJR17_043 TaxID=2175660 RepID=UPI0024DF9560|nr:TetR/AcrR family transcriptional regulator [Curtobacterium sp. MCJR17_043]WIB36638.1 helix-turn-helix domain-containing protein [Curtobacterium sp. MCJR17_043]